MKNNNRILIIIATSPYTNTGFAIVGKLLANIIVQAEIFNRIIYIGYSHPGEHVGGVKLDGRIELHTEPISVKRFGASIMENDMVSLFGDISKQITILTIGDPWNFPYMELVAGLNNVRWIPYIPVESMLPATPIGTLASKYTRIILPSLYRTADLPVAYSKYGIDMINKIGIDCEDYIYHLIDIKEVQGLEQSDKSKAVTQNFRQLFKGKKIIGSVCSNTFRKGIDLMISATQVLRNKYNIDAVLLFHIPRGIGDNNVFNIDALAYEMDVPVVICEDIISKKNKESGQVTVIGYDDDVMDGLYRSMDIYLNLSRSEGFGLPILSASSRNVRTVVSGFGTMKEVAGKVGISTVKTHDYLSSSCNTSQLYHNPDVDDAALVIKNTLDIVPAYNLEEFDSNSKKIKDSIVNIIEKAFTKKKNNKKVIVSFSETYIVPERDNTYTINVLQSGLKDIRALLNTCRLYSQSKQKVNLLIDHTKSNPTMQATYISIITELFKENNINETVNVINNIYATSNIFSPSKSGDNIFKTEYKLPTDIKPYGYDKKFRRSEWFVNDNLTEQDKKDTDLIIITVGNKSVKTMSTFFESLAKHRGRILHCDMKTHSSPALMHSIPDIHINCLGIKTISPDLLGQLNRRIKKVILPYDLNWDFFGQWLVRFVNDRLGGPQIVVNSIIKTIDTFDTISSIPNNIIQLYGKWNLIDYFINEK